MRKKRLIPVVLLRGGMVVQSKAFKRYQALGNPATMVGRLSNWSSDELIYLDISREAGYDLNRDDLKYQNRNDFLEILSDVAAKCFMPLTVGGGIRSLEEARLRIRAGADKIAVNTGAFRDPALLSRCAAEFGCQAVVLAVDARRREGGGWEVFVDGGRMATGRDPAAWALEAQERGAGEILLGSIDRDGAGSGYDLDLIARVAQKVKIPVVALGGVGNWDHLAQGLDAGADAVAAANIFQYTENSVHLAKEHLYRRGYPVRRPRVRTLVSEGAE